MGWTRKDMEVCNIFVLFMLLSVRLSLCLAFQTIITQAGNEFIGSGKKEGGRLSRWHAI